MQGKSRVYEIDRLVAERFKTIGAFKKKLRLGNGAYSKAQTEPHRLQARTVEAMARALKMKPAELLEKISGAETAIALQRIGRHEQLL